MRDGRIGIHADRSTYLSEHDFFNRVYCFARLTRGAIRQAPKAATLMPLLLPPPRSYMRRQILRRRDEVAAGNLGLQADESQVAQEVIDGYLKPLTADNWDRGALLNMRAFTIPPAYDYASLAQPVLLVQESCTGPPGWQVLC